MLTSPLHSAQPVQQRAAAHPPYNPARKYSITSARSCRLMFSSRPSGISETVEVLISAIFFRRIVTSSYSPRSRTASAVSPASKPS